MLAADSLHAASKGPRIATLGCGISPAIPTRTMARYLRSGVRISKRIPAAQTVARPKNALRHKKTERRFAADATRSRSEHLVHKFPTTKSDRLLSDSVLYKAIPPPEGDSVTRCLAKCTSFRSGAAMGWSLQVFFHTGVRFSRNASMPSLPSWLVSTSSTYWRSAAAIPASSCERNPDPARNAWTP